MQNWHAFYWVFSYIEQATAATTTNSRVKYSRKVVSILVRRWRSTASSFRFLLSIESFEYLVSAERHKRCASGYSAPNGCIYPLCRCQCIIVIIYKSMRITANVNNEWKGSENEIKYATKRRRHILGWRRFVSFNWHIVCAVRVCGECRTTKLLLIDYYDTTMSLLVATRFTCTPIISNYLYTLNQRLDTMNCAFFSFCLSLPLPHSASLASTKFTFPFFPHFIHCCRSNTTTICVGLTDQHCFSLCRIPPRRHRDSLMISIIIICHGFRINANFRFNFFVLIVA